jgi:microcystin degradation protein MlrC
LVALHGAWLSESHLSADGELMRRVRQCVGPHLPVVITLDFHANVRPELLRHVQGLVGYRTYPHIDMAETGRKAARLLDDILRRGFGPQIYCLPIPLLAPPQSATTDHPLFRSLMNWLDEDGRSEGVLASSFFCVQPWLDAVGVASSLVIVAEAENARIPARLQEIAQELWDRRGEFRVDWVVPEDLMEKVRRSQTRPVIASEAYDSPSGGAPGDHPGMLSLLIPHRQEVSACLYVVDPEAALEAHRLGLNAEFRGTLGGRKDLRFGFPVQVEGRIRFLSDGMFTLRGPSFTGKRADMGPTAVVETGKVKIVLASRPVIMIDPELYRSQGIEPRDHAVVAVKSPTMFRAGYAGMLDCVLDLDMPGVCRGNLEKVPFSKIQRPIYPLDEFQWRAASEKVLRFPEQPEALPNM